MKVSKVCLCGTTTIVKGNSENIEDLKREVKIFDRETLISGLCHKCQSELFNVPLEGDTSFGELIGYCSICECRIYEKDMYSNNFRCPSCYSILLKEHSDICGYIIYIENNCNM